MAEIATVGVSPETFKTRAAAEVESIAVLRASLAGIAIKTAAEKKVLRDVADELLEAATELVDTVDELTEDKEPFGGAESYWTVFRFFTSERNRFQLISIQEIWKHLAKNYDVTLETPETIKETLLEWAKDIESDAKERLGLDGFFDEFEGKLVFSERYTQASAPVKPAPGIQIPQPRPIATVEVKTQTVRVEQEIIESEVAEYIVDILSALEHRTAPQPDIKRALVAKYGNASHERLQSIINTMVADGKLLKTRPDKITQLSLPRPAVPKEEAVKTVEADNEAPPFDIEVRLLTVLSAPGTHVQQTRTPEELARLVFNVARGEKATDEMLAAVRRAYRRLERIGVMTGGRQKIGSGGSKTKSAASSTRRRSASNEVLKVGLVSQQVKEKMRDLIESGEIEAYLDAETTYVR